MTEERKVQSTHVTPACIRYANTCALEFRIQPLTRDVPNLDRYFYPARIAPAASPRTLATMAENVENQFRLPDLDYGGVAKPGPIAGPRPTAKDVVAADQFRWAVTNEVRTYFS